jgi:hypothetical protein
MLSALWSKKNQAESTLIALIWPGGPVALSIRVGPATGQSHFVQKTANLKT